MLFPAQKVELTLGVPGVHQPGIEANGPAKVGLEILRKIAEATSRTKQAFNIFFIFIFQFTHKFYYIIFKSTS
jgi:hypothetical protein